MQYNQSRKKFRFRASERGFSLVELFVVCAMIAILAAISVPYLLGYRSHYRSEDQAMRVMDVLRETGQLALTRRRTMRVEIDLTDNAILEIDENNSDPDTLIKRIPLDKVSDLRNDVKPNTVAAPNPPNYGTIAFATDSVGHMVGSATVTGHRVWVARFQSDGSVVNNAGNPISVTMYIWPPITNGSTTARDTREVRAVTLFGGSGAIRYWKYNGTTWAAF